MFLITPDLESWRSLWYWGHFLRLTSCRRSSVARLAPKGDADCSLFTEFKPCVMTLKTGWVTIREKSLMYSLGCQAGVMVNNNASHLVIFACEPSFSRSSSDFEDFLWVFQFPPSSKSIHASRSSRHLTPIDSRLSNWSGHLVRWWFSWSSGKRNGQFELMAFASSSFCVCLLCVMIRSVNCLRLLQLLLPMHPSIANRTTIILASMMRKLWKRFAHRTFYLFWDFGRIRKTRFLFVHDV